MAENERLQARLAELKAQLKVFHAVEDDDLAELDDDFVLGDEDEPEPEQGLVSDTNPQAEPKPELYHVRLAQDPEYMLGGGQPAYARAINEGQIDYDLDHWPPR